MRKEAKDQKEREAHAGKYVSVQTSSKKRRRDRGDNDEDDEEDAIVSRKDDFSPEILAALKSVLDLDPTNTGACQAAMRSHRSRFLENDVLSPPSFESWDAFRDGCDTACTEYDMREAERVELEAHTNAGVDDSDDDDDDDDGGSVRTSDAEFLTDDEDQGERVVLVESDSDDKTTKTLLGTASPNGWRAGYLLRREKTCGGRVGWSTGERQQRWILCGSTKHEKKSRRR